MKATKALKRLAKVEALLSSVIERYAGSEHSVQQVLQEAKDAVIRAKDTLSPQASSPKSKNTSAKAGKPNRRRGAVISGTTKSPS